PRSWPRCGRRATDAGERYLPRLRRKQRRRVRYGGGTMLEHRIATIPLSKIELDPENVRTFYDQESVEHLRAALRSSLVNREQYINPPVVYPVGADQYRVKHGNCRVMAARGIVDELQVRIVEPPASRGEKILDQLGENLLQGGLNAMDTALALQRLRDTEELSIAGIVDVLAERGIGRGKFWVKLHLGLVDLHPVVQQAIRSGDIAPRVAWLLRTLPHLQQVQFCREIVEKGLTRTDVERRLGLGKQPADESADVDTSSPEFAYTQIRERIEAAAEDIDNRPANAPRQSFDPQRKSSAVRQRWELVPASLPQAVQTSQALQGPDVAGWVGRATESERRLAQEALFYGGCQPEEAIALVDELADEAQDAPAVVIQAL